jgi:hypothetical protein
MNGRPQGILAPTFIFNSVAPVAFARSAAVTTVLKEDRSTSLRWPRSTMLIQMNLPARLSTWMVNTIALISHLKILACCSSFSTIGCHTEAEYTNAVMTLQNVSANLLQTGRRPYTNVWLKWPVVLSPF